MANCCIGHRVGHGRLDDFATLRTIILLNREIGHFRLDPVGDVFGVTLASRAATLVLPHETSCKKVSEKSESFIFFITCLISK